MAGVMGGWAFPTIQLGNFVRFLNWQWIELSSLYFSQQTKNFGIENNPAEAAPKHI